MFEDHLASIPQEPPRPVTLLPGLRLSSAVPPRTIALPLLFVLLFALMPLLFLLQDPEARLVLGRSETTTGTVLEVAQRDDYHQRAITYAFRSVSGPEYRASQAIRRRSPYANVRPGDSVPVKFLVSDPSVSVIAGEEDPGPSVFFPFLMFPLFGLVFLGPFVAPRLRAIMRDRWLFRRGRITTATVIFVKQRTNSAWPGWPGWSAADVVVGFHLPSGESAEATLTCHNEWLLHHLAPRTSVRVAYSPDRPARAMLLDAYVR
jgi:hypothetical protein